MPPRDHVFPKEGEERFTITTQEPTGLESFLAVWVQPTPENERGGFAFDPRTEIDVALYNGRRRRPYGRLLVSNQSLFSPVDR